MGIKLTSIVLLLALACCQVWGQTQVRGTVKDASDGKAITGAIVRLEDNTGKTLSYAVSDKSGNFSISSDKVADSLKVSFLGYHDVLLAKPLPQSVEVLMEQKKDRIEASTVVANKVQIAGDTISYNVKALTNPQDRVLSDVLKRIPGLDVTSSGAVTYNGKTINRFYVNGKDVLQTDYKQVSKGLPVDYVKTVEVLTNHQPIKMLQGVKDSDRAAVNIQLDDSAAARLLGAINAGAGGKLEKPYPAGRGVADLFVLKDNMSSVNNLTADYESGYKEQQAVLADMTMSYYHENLRYMASFPGVSLPFSGLSAESERTIGGSSVERFSLGKDGSFGGSFKISSAQTTTSQQTRSIYKSEGADKEIFTGGQRTTSPMNMTGSLSYTKNSSGIYFNDKLLFNRDMNDGYSETVGDVSGKQYVQRNRFYVENEATVGFRTASRSIMIDSFTQFSSAGEDMQLEDYGVRQTIGSTLFRQQLAMSGIKRSKGQWQFSVRPSASFDSFQRNSLLEGLPEDVAPGQREGTDNSRKAEFGFTGGLQYGVSPFVASLDAKVSYSMVWWNRDLYKKVLGDISLNLDYVTGRWEWRSSFSIASRSPDLQAIGSSVINTSYNYLWRGIDAPTYRPTENASMSILFREPVTGWHISADATWSHSKSYLNARNIYGTYILNYRSDEHVDSHSFTGRFEFNKGLFAINGKIKLTMSGAWSMSSFQQNSKVVSYNTSLYTPGIELSISPVNWWSTDMNAAWNVSFLQQDGYSVSDRITSASLEWKNHFIPVRKLIITATTDAGYNSAMNIWVFIPSVNAEWKFSDRFSLSLSADNLLNLREISYSTLSPLLVETISYRVRPLSVIATVRWQL